MRNRAALASGAVLILLGVLLMINILVPTTWPLILVAIGGVLFFAALAGRLPGLMISASINTILGCIFLWQAAQGDYSSWLYVWPLVPGSVGLGMLVAAWMGMPGRRARFFAWVFLILSLLFTALGWWLNTQGWLSWPMIPTGLGLLFLLTALMTQTGGLAIAGTILAGVGGLLYWQNASGNWASWAYSWALIPGFVGLGFLIANLCGLRSRPLRIAGVYFIFWSLLFFAIFAAFFGRDLQVLQYWPALIILLGIWLLARAFTGRAKAGSDQS